jgi:hypothetical protein
MAPSVKQIVEKAMPGWRLQEDGGMLDAAKAEAAPPDQVGKSAAELKRKYLRKTRSASKDIAEDAAGNHAERLRFARVVEKNPKDAAVGAKTVLVDPVSGKVRAAQG